MAKKMKNRINKEGEGTSNSGSNAHNLFFGIGLARPGNINQGFSSRYAVMRRKKGASTRKIINGNLLNVARGALHTVLEQGRRQKNSAANNRAEVYPVQSRIHTESRKKKEGPNTSRRRLQNPNVLCLFPFLFYFLRLSQGENCVCMLLLSLLRPDSRVTLRLGLVKIG